MRTMFRASLGFILCCSAVTGAHAAPATDAYCADMVDFAIRTAERRSQGKTFEEISTMVTKSQRVFKQQYPDLEEPDMQLLVKQVYEGQWTRFLAARSTIRSCAVQLDAAPPAAVAPTPAADASMDGVRS